MVEKKNHLLDYIKVILRRRWIIITFFITLVITVFIGSLKQKPIYQATATLLIERQSPNVVSFKEVTSMGPGDYQMYKEYYETQYKLIKSRSLLGRVMDSLGLKAAYSSKNKKLDPTEKFSRVIKVSPVRNSQLVEISAEYPDPQMTSRIANAVADEYMKQNLEINVNTASEAGIWLSKKIEEQRQKVMESELVLQGYRAKHNINLLPQITGEAAIEDVKAEYARLQALFDNYSQRYTDEHPKMIELKAQINSLKNKIQGLEDVDIGNKTMEYIVMEKELQSNKQMYEILLNRLKEIALSSTLTGNNISIVDRAEVPNRPFKPNLKLNMVLAIIVGLVMGTGLGLFVDYLDTTIKSPEDIREILESHLLGVIPNIEEEDEFRKDKIMHFEPSSPISEAYRNIRTDILKCVSDDNKSARTILVTSAEPQAGKTMTVSNLGIALSHQGKKVMLVDSDLRKPQLHRIFNLNREMGLTEYLLDGTNVESIIKDTEIENLKVITSGKIPRNPAEVLGTGKMDELIQNLKDKFDFILFDSPPVVSLTDSVILADKVDALVQVVRSGKSFVPLTLRAKEQLANTKAKILGVILNDLDTYNDDYYYYKYYHYYYAVDGQRRRKAGELSWDSKTKVNELFKKLTETWDSIKSDLKKMALLISDRMSKDRNMSSKKENDENDG